MRRSLPLLVLLLAGVAAPAFAGDRDGNNRSVFRERRADREKSSDDAPRREAPSPPKKSAEPRDNPGRAAVAGPTVEQPRGERRAAGDTIRNWRQSSDTEFRECKILS